MANPTYSPDKIVQTESLLEQGLSLHKAGNFNQAIATWQQAIQDYALQEDSLAVALANNYLSLSYQELEQWQEAESAIAKSLNLLQSLESSPSPLYFEILAKSLNTQGRWQWEQSQFEAALATWRQATINYQEANNNEGIIISLLNQAQVLQILGFSTKAKTTLETVYQNLQQQPDSLLKSRGM
ncbi:MAG: tetratricopeptide repeat protein, partial [Cyanobacteria bacterium J06638_38]